MKVLIVDDDVDNSRLLIHFVKKLGHESIHAINGKIGVEMFDLHSPDLVLMDVRMPVMDGYEAAKIIKARSIGDYVPMLFLTAKSDDHALAKCIESGGDDFLTKPYSYVVLQAKLRAMERIRNLTRTVHLQHQELLIQQSRVEADMEIAENTMSKIMQSVNVDIPCLRHKVDSMERFCGDLVISNRTPSGGIMVLVGDLTGHGLPAAVCAVPISSVFYSMSSNGFSLGDIVCEINSKLLQVLSTGLFCAATLIEVDNQKSRLAIWNGGMPETMILGKDRQLIRRIVSSQLALGIAAGDRSYGRVEFVDIEEGMQVLTCSDGVFEAFDTNGKMLGETTLLAAVQDSSEDLLESVYGCVMNHAAGVPIDDDVSIVTIDTDLPLQGDKDDLLDEAVVAKISAQWKVSWQFGADTLKVMDPLPIIISAWKDFPAPISHRENVYTVIAELFCNALDHGILGLDSSIKESADGFVRYYSERENRLSALKDCFLNVSISHEPHDYGGRVTIVVEDSGPGFDVLQPNAQSEGSPLCGRGVSLINKLCDSVEYNSKGNRAEACYSWQLVPA